MFKRGVWSSADTPHIVGSEHTGDEISFLARVSRVTWRVSNFAEGGNVSVGLFPKFALAQFFFFARPKFALKNKGNETLVT